MAAARCEGGAAARRLSESRRRWQSFSSYLQVTQSDMVCFLAHYSDRLGCAPRDPKIPPPPPSWRSAFFSSSRCSRAGRCDVSD